ncbi:MAG: hypothetical protein HY665_06675 [Chloroflexi bacterium]|nr:hypothetical protein [Chloroflexota bacterium]
MQVPEKKKKKRGRSMPLFQIIIVVGLLSLVWFAFGSNVLSQKGQPVTPEHLGTLALGNMIEGPEALAQINNLHGTTIALSNGHIAEYANGKERMTVWLGEAESNQAAVDLLNRMVAGIAKGGSPFGNLTRLTTRGNEVFQVDGPGGKSFFYISSRDRVRVVWLTIQSPDASPILDLALKAF